MRRFDVIGVNLIGQRIPRGFRGAIEFDEQSSRAKFRPILYGETDFAKWMAGSFPREKPFAIVVSSGMKSIALTCQYPFPRGRVLRLELATEFRAGARLDDGKPEVILLLPPVSLRRAPDGMGELQDGEFLIRCHESEDYLVKVEGIGR